MKTTVFLAVILCLMAIPNELSYGAIEGISINNSNFSVWGNVLPVGDYSGNDSVYALEGVSEQGNGSAFSSAGIIGPPAWDEEIIEASASFDAFEASAYATGTVDFTPLTESLSLIIFRDALMPDEITGSVSLKDKTTDELLYASWIDEEEQFYEATFSWIPIMSHEYTLDFSIGVAKGPSFGEVYRSSKSVNLNMQIVPEPATMCLLGLGGLLLRRKRRA